MLPFILSQADYWRYTEGFHEEIEWEYVVNEMLRLVQEYDYFYPQFQNDLIVSLYKEETIQNYKGPTFPKADANLKVVNHSIILSKNGGTEPVVYSTFTFSFESLENGFLLKRHKDTGETEERYIHMRRISNG